MAPIKTVVLAGATGNIGAPVLQALLDSGFEVTALTRASSNSTFPSNVKVAKVDYDNLEQLTEALKGQDALISTITTAGVGGQDKLVDAAIAAGVKRLIPSEFGSNTLNANASKLPVYGPKVAIQKAIESKVKGMETTYTYVINNAFLDWGIERPFLVDLKGKKFAVYDGGNVPFSATTLGSIAKATANILKHPDETANRAVYIHDMILTQNQLLAAAQKVLGSEGWTVEQKSTEETEKQAWDAFKADAANAPAWVYGFLLRTIYGGKAYESAFGEEDNKLLGLNGKSENDLEEIVRKAAQTLSV